MFTNKYNSLARLLNLCYLSCHCVNRRQFSSLLCVVYVDISGDIGPFQVAVALSFLTIFLVLPWRENFGGAARAGGSEAAPGDSFWTSAASGVRLIAARPVILCLGLSQAMFEGAVYTFGNCLLTC